MASTKVLRTALRSTSSFLSSTTTKPLSNIIIPITTSSSIHRTLSTTTTTTRAQSQSQSQSQSQPQQQQQQQQQQQNTSLPPPPTPSTSLRQYPYTVKVGTVTRVGGMQRTVRVAHRHTEWDRHIRKRYAKVTTYLVSDPRESLREGDVIEFSSGARKSRRVRHVVERIVAPFGDAIDQRPPVMSREERDADRAEKRSRKMMARRTRKDNTTDDDDDQVIIPVGRIRALVMERLAAAAENEKKETATQQATV